MPDPRFFTVAGPFTLAELAERGQARLARGDPHRTLSGLAPLESATADDAGFLEDRQHLERLRRTRAGACVLREDVAAQAPADAALLLTPEPYRAFARLSRMFFPEPATEPGVHPTAQVAETARVGAGTRIGPGAVVGENVEVGAGCDIGPYAVVGAGVVIDDGCRIGAHVSLSCCLIGRGVMIHAGARIGQEGFGFAPGREGHEKIAQVGRVVIEDGVEIGANSAIDRGTLDDTVIGAGTKIDNLVQIGHNVRLGKGCILAGQAGVSGSTIIGNFVMIGGQGGLSGHLKVGDGARVAAKAGVMRDIPAGQDVFGTPAMAARQFMRQVAILKRLATKKED